MEIKLKAPVLKTWQELHSETMASTARKIGCSPQTLRRAISGENVSAGFIGAACTGLKIPFETLFSISEKDES